MSLHNVDYYDNQTKQQTETKKKEINLFVLYLNVIIDSLYSSINFKDHFWNCFLFLFSAPDNRIHSSHKIH